MSIPNFEDQVEIPEEDGPEFVDIEEPGEAGEDDES